MGASLNRRVGVITTVRHNVGDDFVREGIAALLRESGVDGTIESIHKHSPVTAVHGFEWIRYYRLSQLVEPITRMAGLGNRIDQANLLLQSGAPVYWCHEGGPHCWTNEWFDPLVRKRFLPARGERPFVSLAGGSCQRYHWTEETPICPRCSAYMRDFHDACDLTLLRDDMARTMLRSAGRDAEVLPCTSIFARDALDIRPEPGEYIVLNFMDGGGHYTFGQPIDKALWRRQFVELAHKVARMGRVVLACHSPREEALARQLVPELERFLVPDDHVAFMKFYARARWGILNRVHGAFMMASFGRPAVVVGTDSRALMIGKLGLPSYYVSDVAASGLDSIIEAARGRTGNYGDEIEAIRTSTRSAYVDALKQVVA